MAYPTSPTNGQVFGNKKFNSTKGVWENFFAPPIGTIYTQLPGKSDPATLYGGTWTNISSQFAGLFTRIEGGNAETFGKQLTISTATTTVITFTAAHGLVLGSVIQNSAGEVRVVSTVNSTTQVTVGTAFSSIPSGQILCMQGYLMQSHTFSASSTLSYQDVSYGAASGTTFTYMLTSGGTTRSKGVSTSISGPNANGQGTPQMGAETRPMNATVRIWERTA